MSLKLNSHLREILRAAYSPCDAFGGVCRKMQWKPECGHAPRGFCGAIGKISEVQVVLLCAEPGDPHENEDHSASSPDKILDKVYQYAHDCFEGEKDPFHGKVRHIMNLIWPNESLENQLRKTWITDSVLCSAKEERGHISKQIASECVRRYLRPQLKLFHRASVIALGHKAYNRINYISSDVKIIKAYAAAPPGCYRSKAKDTWKKAAEIVKRQLTTG